MYDISCCTLAAAKTSGAGTTRSASLTAARGCPAACPEVLGASTGEVPPEPATAAAAGAALLLRCCLDACIATTIRVSSTTTYFGF